MSCNLHIHPGIVIPILQVRKSRLRSNWPRSHRGQIICLSHTTSLGRVVTQIQVCLMPNPCSVHDTRMWHYVYLGVTYTYIITSASPMKSSSDMEPSLTALIATWTCARHSPKWTTPNWPLPISFIKASSDGSISHFSGKGKHPCYK